MAAVNYPVIGAPKLSPAPVNGSVPLRLEIRDLQKNKDLWNLYLLGLDAFKNTDETTDLSYYGIAGIHGRPYRPWGGVQGVNKSRNGWQGYCTHTSILFAPWHRPYLALFEQVLYGIIQNIAAQFPTDSRSRYQAAALTFRVPYWDWAITPDNGEFFPNSVGGVKTVSVITPTSGGKPVTIANPLYTNKFHPLNPIAGDFTSLDNTPFDKWPATLRYPSSTTDLNAVSEEDQVFDAMTTQNPGLQQNVNILLNDPNYKEFANFSNHKWEQNTDPSTFASLEDIHNSIHVAVGGFGGHMSELDYSAFDPVFWLHHTNVDRLFAVWQALNPNSYTIDKVDPSGTFAIRANTTETASTPLEPFADASGQKFWTSEAVRRTETFNYAYPETQQWAFSTTSDYQNSILDTVQQLYGGVSSQMVDSSAVNLMTSSTSVPDSAEAAPAQQPIAEHHSTLDHLRGFADKVKDVVTHSHNKPNTDSTRGLDLEAEIGKPIENPPPQKASTYKEYIANIQAPKHILNQSYRIHVFLGPFTPGTKTWQTQDALVGTVAVFGKDTRAGSKDETGCGKCKDDAEEGTVITGTVPLTAQLLQEVKKGNCAGMDSENVLPYLKENLHWRVTLADGTEREREQVPGLVLSVVSTEVTVPVGGRPTYSGVYVVHPEVTAGRPAGYGTHATAGGSV